jgi:hypothetical protein
MRLLTPAAGLVAVLALAGCGGGGSALERDGVRTFVGPATNAGDDARIAGELVVSDGRCLAVEGADGVTYVLVWPAGTSMVEDGVEVPGAGRILVGDRFAAGGGYGEPDAPTVPVDCRAGADPDEIAVIQRADTVRKG